MRPHHKRIGGGAGFGQLRLTNPNLTNQHIAICAIYAGSGPKRGHARVAGVFKRGGARRNRSFQRVSRQSGSAGEWDTHHQRATGQGSWQIPGR